MGVLKTAAFISLPILGLCATILYLFHKKEEDDLQDSLVTTSRFNTLEMKIPKSVIGVIIGRGGSNIKEIQQKTDTKITFSDRDDNDEYRTCFIRGTAEANQMAEIMLHEIVTSQPIIEIRETWIPQLTTGRVIGRNGESIRSITRASNAKINIISSTSSKSEGSSGKTKIIIKGTSEQIAVALSLIQEKVDEDAEVRRKMEFCQANRSPRNKQNNNSSDPAVTNPIVNKKVEISEYLTATGSDGILQVFVSSVYSPSCFWVQVYSSRAVELDHLIDEMTEYYSSEENRDLHAIKQLEVGQIVAAPFHEDERWYRAEIRQVELDDNKVDVYYVDYGDSDYLKGSDVFQLRTDFLKLRFQAIECKLAHVKPSEGDNWSEKTIEVFEELCHVAQWRPLMVKVVACDGQPRGRKEGSPVPRVLLYDTSGTQDINIGEELIKQGFAVKEDNLPSTSKTSL